LTTGTCCLREFLDKLKELVEKVEKKELDVFEVSIISLIEQFQKHIIHSAVDIEEATLFLWLITRLIELKIFSIFPRHFNSTKADEDEAKEAYNYNHKFDLNLHFAEYKKFKELATYLKALEERESFYYKRKGVNFLFFEPEVLKDLLSQINRKFNRKKQEILISAEVYSLLALKEKLYNWLLSRKRSKFSEFLFECSERREAVVGFLALMELIKEEKVLAKQNKNFGEIYLTLL